jgi:hypothetical protein
MKRKSLAYMMLAVVVAAMLAAVPAMAQKTAGEMEPGAPGLPAAVQVYGQA